MRPGTKFFLIVAAAVLGLDQVSKVLVNSMLARHQLRPLIPGLLNLTRVHNTGVAFGLLAGESTPVRTFFFLLISILAMALVLWMLLRLRPDQKLELLALSLIFGGALGNVVDRARLGEVIDFLDIYYGSHHWPAFNLADTAISAGVILLVGRQLLQRH